MTEVREAVEIAGGVLVGHDGSECAQRALRWAAGLAARADLDLHVLRACLKLHQAHVQGPFGFGD